MSKQSFQEAIRIIPKKHRKITVERFAAITGGAIVQDRIIAFFQGVWQLEKTLANFKVAHGYCGGFPNCTAYVGKNPKHKACSKCRKQANNPKRSNRVSEYGKMRRQQRKEQSE